MRVCTLVAVAVGSVVFAGHAAAEGDPASAPAVQLMSPNGPATWYVGDDCTAWADIADDDGVGYVEFRLSIDDGATYPILLGGVDGVNSIDCVVPDVETTTARVKVLASDTLGNTASDVSDYAFTIKTRPTAIAGLWLSPTKVVGGNPVQATLELSGPAPAGGAAVALASSNRSAATVPATVTVPEGEWETTVAVSTAAVPASTTVRLSASYGGYTEIAMLTIAPAVAVPPRVAAVAFNPTIVVAGKSSKVTVTLTEPAPAEGATIALTSSDPTVATVEEHVFVEPGATTGMSVVATIFGSVATSTTVTVGASYGGATISAPLTVTPSDPARSFAILRADYTFQNGKLRIAARSGSATESLHVYVTSTGELIGTLKNVGGGDYIGKFNWPTNPIQITVLSEAGAMVTVRVRAR